VTHSIPLLKAIAAEVDLKKFQMRSCTWGHELLVIPHHGGIQIEVLVGWMESTGMGAEYETTSLFKGPAHLAFTFLCEAVQS
jgi:hypothetical protein